MDSFRKSIEMLDDQNEEMVKEEKQKISAADPTLSNNTSTAREQRKGKKNYQWNKSRTFPKL